MLTTLTFVLSSTQFQSIYTSASAMHGCRLAGGGKVGPVALPVKALKAGQESYWLDQIARNREEYFSGRGESPGRFVGSAAASQPAWKGSPRPEQVRAMFQGLDPATGEQRCAPLWRADPRSKLAAGPLLEALKTRAAEQRRRGAGGRWPGPRRSRGTCGRCRRPAGWAAPAGQGGDGRAAVPQGPGHRPARAVRGGVRAGLAAPGQAGQRAGAGLRPLLQLPQERVAAGRRRRPPDPAAAGRGTRRGPPGRDRLPGAPRHRRPPRPQRHRPLPGGRGAGGGGVRAPHEPRRRPQQSTPTCWSRTPPKDRTAAGRPWTATGCTPI